MQVLQKELLARGDADSLAAGALFARLSATPDGSLELAARAVAAAPDRADLLLEQIQLCQKVPACDSQVLEAHLRQLDPDNGISWTYALWRADRTGDLAELRRDRAGLARAQRVDWHWNQIVSRMTAAVTGKAGYSSEEALVNVIGIEAAFITPLQPVSKACSAQEIQAPEVLAQCRQIAEAFRRGDTYLIEMYGTSLAAACGPQVLLNARRSRPNAAPCITGWMQTAVIRPNLNLRRLPEFWRRCTRSIPPSSRCFARCSFAWG